MGAQLFVYCCTEASTTTLKASGDAPACSAEDPQSRASYRAVSALSLLTERNTRLGLCAEMRLAILCTLKHQWVIKGLGVDNEYMKKNDLMRWRALEGTVVTPRLVVCA